LDAVSKPAGGYSPAAEGKLGKVPHEEKTSVVYVFLAVVWYGQMAIYDTLFMSICSKLVKKTNFA
jgi:hypothetical protein